MLLSLAPFVLAFPLLAAAGAVVDPNNLPHQSENGKGEQAGYNDCNKQGGDSPDSQCQTSWIQSLDDFCLFAPPNPNTAIGDSERYEVSWCTKAGHGARLIPEGAITGAHVVTTPHYIQITGVGDLTKINVARGDAGGELDPHGYQEWTEFLSDSEFCIRACYPGPDAWRYCQHIYPANYEPGTFEQCEGDDVAQPMGVYSLPGGTISTWYQGTNPTPAAQPVPKSSSCSKQSGVGGQAYPNGQQAKAAAVTPAPKAAAVTPAAQRMKRSGIEARLAHAALMGGHREGFRMA
ncbi:hypothetical protein RQP46_005250 [Phenoliferia psychrophenolica]